MYDVNSRSTQCVQNFPECVTVFMEYFMQIKITLERKFVKDVVGVNKFVVWEHLAIFVKISTIFKIYNIIEEIFFKQGFKCVTTRLQKLPYGLIYWVHLNIHYFWFISSKNNYNYITLLIISQDPRIYVNCWISLRELNEWMSFLS